MSKYTEAVERELRGLKYVSVGQCDECGDCDGNEGFFSRYACDSCRSSLAGKRYAAHAQMDGTLIHLDICEDCVHFLAYGTEPKNWE